MPIIATAGHVDHGKSTLVEALTGRDPDRWAEEKERGLTIDLGFAWSTLGETEVGFVDVPGHERFIKNMLAGMGAVDIALFVVAADEGWMPQSEEHLAILDLLGTARGVIALTRIDLADPETVDLAELGILEATEGTLLSEWPIVRVSPVTGVGMEELRAELDAQLRVRGPSPDMDRPRLWIDRSFSIPGAGLVVTGTLAGGWVAEGDELALWPGEVPVRVRGVQSHEAARSTLGPGTRAALNVVGIETVNRGAMLGRPGSFRTSSRFLAAVRTVRSLESEVLTRGAYHLHLGSGAWPAEVRLLETDREGAIALLRTQPGIPLQVADRFILRETGRRAVVAGGSVLDPHPAERSPQLREAIRTLAANASGNPDEIADRLLGVRGTATLDDLARDSGGGTPSSPFRHGQFTMAPTAAAALCESVIGAVTAYHAENRLRPGMPKATLASSLGTGADSITLVVAGSEDLVDDGATIRLAEFSPGLATREQQAWDHAREQLGAGLAVPRASQLGLSTELLYALARSDALVRIGEDLVYLPDQIAEIDRRLEELSGEFTVAEFRDLIGVTRRHAVPLLEWFDGRGRTVRHGDVRSLRPRQESDDR
ncbi:MAG: selenocysteine-specific translation elongation factor [Acidimicrobiia bacterium]|nr:selenocysteine-specific translation elongation factor [Acidimicrobiia bacterium]